MRTSAFARVAVLVTLLLVQAVTWASDALPATAIAIQIHAEYERSRTSFRVAPQKAVAQLDDMLVHQYGAKGRISSEPDAALKKIFYDAATLLMNGYPIAGGTLVSYAKTSPAMARSAAGAGLVQFVDAMLQPTGEDDDDLLVYERRASRATAALSVIKRYDVRLAAQVAVLGAVYDDGIAVTAGRNALTELRATDDELKALAAARAAAQLPVQGK